MRRRCAPRSRKCKSELGREYPLVIGGERIETDAKLDSINPANRTQVVGRFQKATKELANQAVESANDAFQTWKNTSAQERADLLFRVAAILRERKHELSAWMIHEVAKTWAEADGDTAEAIDFLEFYGREMLRYAGDQPLVKIRRRRKPSRLHPAWRGCGDSAVELSTRNHGRHDGRRFCDRQHRRPEAFIRRADNRLQVFRDS